MVTLVVCVAAFAAATLTFFSGFGLGTLLLPVFALFFPVEQAVALTAVVHFLNGLFKLALVGRHVRKHIVLRFGLPANVAALVGALLLVLIADLRPLYSYEIGGRQFHITPVKLVIGLLLIVFTLAEVLPGFRERQFPPRYLPIGGIVSGFFGGLSGHQGALRTAFRAKAGLSKEEFIATGSAIACLIDVTRLGVYAGSLLAVAGELDYSLLGAAVLAAFAGSLVGNQFLKKITMSGIQWIVTVMLVVLGLALAAGLCGQSARNPSSAKCSVS